jgi:hypothetical protein
VAVRGHYAARIALCARTERVEAAHVANAYNISESLDTCMVSKFDAYYFCALLSTFACLYRVNDEYVWIKETGSSYKKRSSHVNCMDMYSLPYSRSRGLLTLYA